MALRSEGSHENSSRRTPQFLRRGRRACRPVAARLSGLEVVKGRRNFGYALSGPLADERVSLDWGSPSDPGIGTVLH